MTKTETISLQVLALVAQGYTAVDALKEVCGSVKVDQMISDLYDQLRERSQ